MFSSKLQQARKLGKNEGGFTLIELLIVIVILGVLAGIVVFSVKGIQDRGTVAACKSNAAQISTAAEAYYAQVGSYPSAMADITTDNPSGTPKQLLLMKTAPTAPTATFTTTAPPAIAAC